MDGAGGGNGFMFRARSEKDAEVFAQEFQRRARRGRSSRIGTVVVVALVLILLVLGMLDWLG